MKTSDNYLNHQKITELLSENTIEILDNEKLGMIKGGTSDPDHK